jgi:hypothetical protein
MAAFCEVSQILPVFNEGWEPDWDRTTIKHCIQTVGGELVTFATFECRRLLAFKTEEKAQLFLKEKIDLIILNLLSCCAKSGTRKPRINGVG